MYNKHYEIRAITDIKMCKWIWFLKLTISTDQIHNDIGQNGGDHGLVESSGGKLFPQVFCSVCFIILSIA